MKYVTCYTATHEVIWLRNFIIVFNIVESISRPLTNYLDNIATKNFSLNNKSYTSIMHFDMKYQFVREKICDCVNCIQHISTYCMLVDPLTKDLMANMFKQHATIRFVQVF